MPKVSYVKGLDVFLNFCFVMVFASLVEYAIVSYLSKRIALRREKKRKQVRTNWMIYIYSGGSPAKDGDAHVPEHFSETAEQQCEYLCSNQSCCV